MKNRNLLAGISTVIMIGASSAGYAQDDRTYFGFHGMWTDLDDASFQVAPGTIDTKYDSGAGFGVTLGRTYGALRGELEYTARMNDVDSHSLNGGATLPGSKGEATSNAFMVNGYYDFNTDTAFTPYVGAGIGMAKVKFEDFGVAPIPDVLDDSGTQFAYQFMLGGDVAVSDTWKIFAEYRYFRSDDVDATTSNVTGAVDNSISYKTNNVLLGARVYF